MVVLLFVARVAIFSRKMSILSCGCRAQSVTSAITFNGVVER